MINPSGCQSSRGTENDKGASILEFRLPLSFRAQFQSVRPALVPLRISGLVCPPPRQGKSVMYPQTPY
jgi:hypothetical protein